jgi:K+ transporter
VAGSVYALAGAALFCNATFLTPAPSYLSAGSTQTSVEPNAPRRLGAQWLDSRVGAALLVIGFFLQATGAVGTTTLNTPAVFVLLGLALFAGYYAMTKDLLIESLLARSGHLAHEPDRAPEFDEPAPALIENPPAVVELLQSETAA